MRPAELAKVKEICLYLKGYNESTNNTLTDVARHFGVTRHFIVRVATSNNITLRFAIQKRAESEDVLNHAGLTSSNKIKQSVAIKSKSLASIPLEVTAKNTPKGVVKGAVKDTIKKGKGGTTKSKVSTEDVPDYLRLFISKNSTLTLKQLVIDTKLPVDIVKKVLIEEGVRFPKSKTRKTSTVTDENKDYILDNYTLTVSSLSELTGVSVTTVGRVLRDNGFVWTRTTGRQKSGEQPELVESPELVELTEQLTENSQSKMKFSHRLFRNKAPNGEKNTEVRCL